MDDTASVKQIESKIDQESAEFVDAAIQNPDNDRRGGIPDLVDGPSFVRSQTISTNITGAGVVGANYDVYVVQWDFEILKGQVGTGAYHPRTNMTVYAKNLNDLTASSTLEIGGLVAYIMEENTSPFPSDNPAVTGPVAPVSVVPLRYASDIFSGNTRVIGSDFQVKYTGPELSAQGLWTQSTFSSYKGEETIFFNIGANPANVVKDQLKCETKSLLPGDVSTMVKYPGSVQRAIYDGVLQTAVINYHNNFPTLPLHKYKKYEGIIPTAAGTHFDLFYIQIKNSTTGAPFVRDNPPIWDSNCELHYAVGTGIPKTAPLQLIRRISVETFPNPNDNLIAFAKPSPLADLALLTDVMNAFRTSQRFWANEDNALGNFSRALKKGVKKFKKVGSTAVQVAGPMAMAANPQAAAALQRAKSARKMATGTMSKEQMQKEMQRMQQAYGQMKVSGESGIGNLSFAKAKRPRTKPANK